MCDEDHYIFVIFYYFSKCSSSNQTLGYDMMSELTDFCANMSDCNRLRTNPVAAYAETESLYARHKLELSICQILHKVYKQLLFVIITSIHIFYFEM